MKKRKTITILLITVLITTPTQSIAASQSTSTILSDSTESLIQDVTTSDAIAEDEITEEVDITEDAENRLIEDSEKPEVLREKLPEEVQEEMEVDAFPEPEKPTDLSYGTYIESDLDQNTPVYEPGIATYAVLPFSFPDEMDKFYATYPSNRNQNPYGTCWAVSSIGLAEFDLINDSLAGRGDFDRSLDLSELQLAYFTYNSVLDPLGGTEGDYTKYYNENASVSYLNYGGNYAMAARRLAGWCGAVQESLVPYSQVAETVTRGLDSSYAYNHDVAHLENAYMINIRQNSSDVKQQIMEHGAVGVMYYHADEAMGWNSTLGQYTYYDSALTGGGHAVMIVGWDDQFSKNNFTAEEKPSSDGAWLVRNSWGLYANYFWMSYETASLADTAWVFDFSENDGYDNNYQLDGGIYTYPDSSHRILANVFKTKQETGVNAETMKAVSLTFSRAANVGYTVEIYTDLTDASDPLSGTRQDSATTSGMTTYAGIYTIPLNHAVTLKPGTCFAVVVTVDSAALDYEQAQSVATDDFTKLIWDCAVSTGNNKSFYYSGNKFYPFYWGNYCIKAFTTDEKIIVEPEQEPAGVECCTHVQDYGWMDPVQNGEVSGTAGKSLRVEAFELKTVNVDGLDINYTSMVCGKGWQEVKKNGAASGTSGQSRQIEAVMISLSGQKAGTYDIWYRVHSQDYGWLAWTSDGAPAGTGEYGKRIEAMQVALLPKGERPTNDYKGVKSQSSEAYMSKSGFVPSMDLGYTLQYQTHVQDYGWMSKVSEGGIGGTIGKGLRMEALNVTLKSRQYSGDIVYTTHVQDYGWMNNVNDPFSWSKNGQNSGTAGKSLRCEAIRIALIGDIANYYDIYYRVHSQDYGWLGWASDGEPAGTSGCSYRMEAIQIALRPKGSGAPAQNYQGVTSAQTQAYISR